MTEPVVYFVIERYGQVTNAVTRMTTADTRLLPPDREKWGTFTADVEGRPVQILYRSMDEEEARALYFDNPFGEKSVRTYLEWLDKEKEKELLHE